MSVICFTYWSGKANLFFSAKKIIREGLLGSTWFISLFSFGEVLPIWGVLHKRADRWRDFASLLFSFLQKLVSETSLDVKLEGLEREERRTKSERRPQRELSLVLRYICVRSDGIWAEKSRPGCRETERQHWQWLSLNGFPDSLINHQSIGRKGVWCK